MVFALNVLKNCTLISRAIKRKAQLITGTDPKNRAAQFNVNFTKVSWKLSHRRSRFPYATMRSSVLTKDFCVFCLGNGQID